MLGGRAEARNIRPDVGVRMGTEAPLIVAGDRDLLKQLVLNLVDNAIKYSPAGEDVFISLLQRDSGAEIVVEDKGLEFRRNNWSGSSSAFTRETRRVRAPSAARASASRSASGSRSTRRHDPR